MNVKGALLNTVYLKDVVCYFTKTQLKRISISETQQNSNN